MAELATAQKTTEVKVIDDVLAYDVPLEIHFFNQKQKDELEKERVKLESTIKYVTAVLDNPELDQDLDKAVAEGKIYSPAMTANVREKIRVVFDGMGTRFDLSKSIISETGQFVLMSENCVMKIKQFTDGTIQKKDIEGFLETLAGEGVAQDKLDKIRQAGTRIGAVIVQRGGFLALKPMLEEALAIENVQRSYKDFKQKLENQDKPVDLEPKKEHGSSISELKSRLEPVKTGPALTPQEIKREIGTPELTDGTTQPVKAAPRTPQAQVTLNKKPISGLKGIDDIKTIDDLKRVEPAHLRQGALPDQVKKLKAKIVYLAAVNKQLPVFALGAFEQSPLFRQYLKIGGAAITGGDSKAGYLQVMTKLKDAGEDVINLYEFEAIADLRKEMERL